MQQSFEGFELPNSSTDAAEQTTKRLSLPIPAQLWSDLELAAIASGYGRREKTQFICKILKDGLEANGFGTNLVVKPAGE